MDYIEILGYKSIKFEKIELNPINILIGANGSGKSNFISFFDFLNKLYDRKLNDYIALSGGNDKILHKGQKNTDSISFKIEFDDGNNGYASTLVSGVNQFIFTSERLIFKGDPGRDISRSDSEARLKITDNYRAPYIQNYLKGLRKYHFHDTSKKSAFTKLSHLENDIYFLYNDGANLSAFLYEIRNTNKIIYNRIVKIIQSIAPYFSDFFFEPNSENYVRLQWMDRYSDVLFGATDLSDGTIRFIALTVLFMQPDLPDTIIIDEPELGLHPSAIAKLAGMIKSVSIKGCQVIIATQSTDLISHFLPEDIITVDQINGESVFKRLNNNELNQWLEDYTIDDLWKRNIITSGQPNF
ncbi:AAA family ATPase [Aquimarina sp. ERC-38]|uniref:AAA family ATPase n=1 Tax=Aquimarina sp. ERC-38 TaxID=2949996 RepID=UPI00224769E6|nr:AAA family ATPase [Aquimarina sp. ERC-38]UZO80194.1 AAA family ATPase [Aquimarina sp. ERC-38]